MRQEMKRSLIPVSSSQAATTPIIWDCGSPLYDSFELASLCHLIERHMMILPSSSSLSSSSSSSSLSSSMSNVSGSEASGSSSSEANYVEKCNLKGMWKRKVDWEELNNTPKKAKRIKVSGCFRFNCRFWKK